MEGTLFNIFAGLTVLSALLVVANPFSRNPVTSALFLVYKSSIETTYGDQTEHHEAAADSALVEAIPPKVGSTQALGQALFSAKKGFILPFEIISVLLLVAMVGVILLSRKEPR